MSAEGGAVGAAVGDLRAGNLRGEQEDDVGGDADAEDGVVDGDGGEAPEGEEDGERDDGPDGEMKMSGDKGGEGCAEDSAAGAGDGTGEGFEEGGLLDEEGGHGDPVAGLDAETAVEFGRESDGDGEADGVADGDHSIR